MQTFTRDIATQKTRDAVLSDALTTLPTPLARYGYTLATQSEAAITFTRTYRPWWVWVLTVVTFPIGLVFFFLITDTATITLVFDKNPDGTLVRVSGVGEPKVQQAFASMQL